MHGFPSQVFGDFFAIVSDGEAGCWKYDQEGEAEDNALRLVDVAVAFEEERRLEKQEKQP